MRMTIINKETGEVEGCINCTAIGDVNSVKAITVLGTPNECTRRGFKPWEIVYDIEIYCDATCRHVLVSSDYYILGFK